MAQHFLLSAKARTLSIRSIYAAGEEKAYEAFKAIRWGATNGEPVCPRCGCLDNYDIAKRRQFQCKACSHRYSVTSGTIFSARKMAFVDLLAAICIFTNAVKGISSLQMARDLDCQQKTAFVLCHKLREAMAAEVEGMELDDVVEIDGAYFGGYVRPANLKEDRVDRRRAENQSGSRRVVVVLRQRSGRTLPFIARSEGEGVSIAKRVVNRLATIHADEAGHWDALHAGWKTKRINHSQAYSFDGACTNQAESYFSRLRRMVTGQHHGVSPKHLSQYAHEAAWKEDHRRMDNGALAFRSLGLGLAHGVSRDWSGYWQRGS